MALLLKNGAVFLHIPKTGGSYITNVLDELNLVQSRVGGEHADFTRAFLHERLYPDAKVLRNLARRRVGWIPKVNRDAYTFCFIREPLSWYVSYWRFMEAVSWRKSGDPRNPYRWHPWTLLDGLGSPDFNEFMRNVNRHRPGYLTELYGWYVEPGTNFVGKQENLVEDLLKVLTELFPEVDAQRVRQIKPLNESPAHIPKPEWDPAVRRETLRLEYAAYVRYKYPLDENELFSGEPKK